MPHLHQLSQQALFRSILKNTKMFSRTFFGFWSKKASYEIVTPGKVSSFRKVPDSLKKPHYWSTGIPLNPPGLPEIKVEKSIEKMRSSCRLASEILSSVKPLIKAGVTTDEIDAFVHNECIRNNAYPSTLNYHNFPKSVCTSVNNVACHGIPDDRKLASGDILNVDITVYKDGFHGDCSAMFFVGEVDETAKKLCILCFKALEEAVKICQPGIPFANIGGLIEEIATFNGFTVIPCFAGHGIGSYFHGPPDIYHFENKYDGVMEEGMTFTIEPVLGEGGKEIEVLEDGWTAVTIDGSRTAQWEHTVLITSNGAEALTHPLPTL